MIGFCTTCKNRTAHVEKTLPENLRFLRETDSKIILLNYGSQDNLMEYIKTNHMESIESGRLVVYRFNELGPFRMAHAKNMVHRLAIREGCDILMNMDADNYAAEGFDTYIKESFTEQEVFLWPNLEELKRNRTGGRGSLKGLNGRIGVTKAAFLKVGGYDERYRTWSPDDKDFDARLRRIGYQRRDIDSTHLQVVLHTDKMRFKEYPHVQSDEYRRPIVEDPDHTIVNYGRIGMGIVYRNFEEESIHLGPLPTRIFGIGWHKTATTSLHTALTALGYDSAHWKSARWAKTIWEEMNQFAKSHTLERSYALCDLPIAPMFGALDLAYPGSKFILTWRNEYEWLDSIRRHWSKEHNPFRKQWDKDHFSHRLHEVLYGTREFDAEIMLKRYRKHTYDVLKYFKFRQQDLLFMNMSVGYGWPELCNFLGDPVPDIPYPIMFQGKQK